MIISLIKTSSTLLVLDQEIIIHKGYVPDLISGWFSVITTTSFSEYLSATLFLDFLVHNVCNEFIAIEHVQAVNYMHPITSKEQVF